MFEIITRTILSKPARRWNTRWKYPRDNKSFKTSFQDLKTTMIVIKLNIVRLDHFVSLDHDHTTQWLSVFCSSRTSFFFSVASKNAWRGTLDSKTQTKERKWVSFELLKFVLGSASEDNKTDTRKGTRNLWYHRNQISYDFSGALAREARLRSTMGKKMW